MLRVVDSSLLSCVLFGAALLIVDKSMAEEVKAVYKDGVFHPLAPVDLPQSEQVSLTINRSQDRGGRNLDIVERAKAELALVTYIPTVEEVQDMLAHVGDLTKDFEAERGER